MGKYNSIAHIVKLLKDIKLIFTWNTVQLSGLANHTGKILVSLKARRFVTWNQSETVLFVHRDKDKLSGCLLITM